MSARNEKWNGEDWEPGPLPAAPCRGAIEAQLECLKERLLAPLLLSITDPALARQLRWAANEAAALAWLTAWPLLVLPTLLEEKIRAALQRWDCQQRLWKPRIPALVSVVAKPAAARLLSRLTPASMAA